LSANESEVSVGDGMNSTLRLPGGNVGGSAASPPNATERKAFMFARHVNLQLKPNVAKEFPVVFEKEILPLLRRQKGFLDELLLVTPEKKEVVAISLWETREHAEAYNRELYPQIEKIVARFIEGFPKVEKFEVEYATFHKMAYSAVV
jgi:heme-degrading monooxygenase HmoA